MNRGYRPSPCKAIACAAALLLAGVAGAQIQVNSSPSPVGSGARALGMGSAFIAVADDATASSWNPAGLTQLQRPELSLVYEFRTQTEKFRSGLEPGFDGDFDVDLDDINYASAAWPLPITIAGRNMVVSLNLQRQYSFDRELDFRFKDNTLSPGGNITSRLIRGTYRAKGELSTLSPAFAFELTNRLSLGVAVNIWDESVLGGNEWEYNYRFQNRSFANGNFPAYSGTSQRETFKDFKATNFTIGALYRASERLQFGFRYDTEFDASVDYMNRSNINAFNLTFARTTTRIDREYTFPSALGLGVAYRFPNDKLTLSLDVTRRDWDEFVYKNKSTRISGIFSQGGFRLFRGPSYPNTFSAITNSRKDLSPHDATYAVRLGAEYVFVKDDAVEQKFLPSVRAGVFYDPEPASGRDDLFYSDLGRILTRGSLLPNTLGIERKGSGKPDDFFGFSVGAGVLIMNRVNLDVAYQYRWGDDARKDTYGFQATDADVDQQAVYVSTVIYF